LPKKPIFGKIAPALGLDIAIFVLKLFPAPDDRGLFTFESL
jgi:hypothetical protein